MNNETTRTPTSSYKCMVALFSKRYQRARRSKKSLFAELIVPPLFILLMLSLTTVLPNTVQRPPLDLNPWIYGYPLNVFYASVNTSDYWSNKYVAGVLGPTGYGTLCIRRSNNSINEKCKRESDWYSQLTIENTNNASCPVVPCSCKSGKQQCPKCASGPTPPILSVVTGDNMYNMTSRNISDWIVKTWDLYSKTRFGGFSFGIPSLLKSALFYMQHNTSSVKNLARMIFNTTNIIASWPAIGALFYSSDGSYATQQLRDETVWYNNKGWATSVSYMNAVNNVVLRSSLPSNMSLHNRSQYGIVTINHPMNYTVNQVAADVLKQTAPSLIHSVGITFALSFVPASFVLYLIEERVSNAKHLQLVTGVGKLTYWIHAYIWDMCSYLFSTFLVTMIFELFQEKMYISGQNLLALVSLLLLYGWSVIPIMYLCSRLFSVPSTAFVLLGCANLFIGVITTCTIFVLQTLNDKELQSVEYVLSIVFLVFPHFCLGEGLIKMAANYITVVTYSAFDIIITSNVFQWNVLGKNLLCMLLCGIVFFLLNLALEFDILQPFFYKNEHSILLNNTCENEEEDVMIERMRILNGDTEQDVLVIKNLSKVYTNRSVPFLAVNQICVGVNKGECFGLLGLNGAGKTTTFKMLTGDIRISSGDAFVCGFSVKTEIHKVRSVIGYCPQFDALDGLLTPSEHLHFYCKLRNISKKIRPRTVEDSLVRFNLSNYASCIVDKLSGGNKRKLSTAIALLGNPPLILLDEPTSGMDPVSRRFLWTKIKQVISIGSSVILTSHSMEECEVLCTRLTVMVNGTFSCLGSGQHLKNKFGQGYNVTIITAAPAPAPSPDNQQQQQQMQMDIAAYLSSHLPSLHVVESHYTQIKYQLQPHSVPLSQVFQILENAKQLNLLQDYSLSQPTLEEVFIKFAARQIDDNVENDNMPPPSIWTFKPSCMRCCYEK